MLLCVFNNSLPRLIKLYIFIFLLYIYNFFSFLLGQTAQYAELPLYAVLSHVQQPCDPMKL